MNNYFLMVVKTFCGVEHSYRSVILYIFLSFPAAPDPACPHPSSAATHRGARRGEGGSIASLCKCNYIVPCMFPPPLSFDYAGCRWVRSERGGGGGEEEGEKTTTTTATSDATLVRKEEKKRKLKKNHRLGLKLNGAPFFERIFFFFFFFIAPLR